MTFFSEENVIDAKAFSVKKCKATIQKCGKLGFSSAAAELMQLAPTKRLLVSDCHDGNLAVVVIPDASDTRGFSLRKSVRYFSADLKMFFDQRGVDYRRSDATVIYDIVKVQETYQGLPVFKLTLRIKMRRNRNAPEQERKEGASENT